jgi:N-acyl-D-amino-acid deacylase
MTAYDIVLANGRILDGCGNPWYWGDLAIQQGRIAGIAPRGTLKGKHMINVSGRYMSPGFIDIHSHSDLTILVNRRAESVVRQGVTTELIGNCGMSPAPIEIAFLDEMQRQWGTISRQPEVTWQ